MAWAASIGVAALLTGLSGGVVALVGFGADSIVDGVASAVMVWRFWQERAGARQVERMERQAARAVGAVLLLLGAYVAVDAVVSLAGDAAPDGSTAGLILAGASMLVLPWFAARKLRLAVLLGSAGLRGDGVLSLAGASLAAITLVSQILDRAAGWWWADGVAALLIAAFMLRESRRLIATASGEPAPAGR